jgi:NAD(P)-dependent dehydrogenase (short-subunit alcohol dehydrogenase family)
MARWAPPSASGLGDRRKMMEVNLHAPVDLAQQVLPGMRKRRRGWILNLSSESARQPQVPYRDGPEAVHAIAAYGASKAALDRYTQGLAHEVAADGICVNSLAPVAIVLTQEAARFAGDIAARHPDMAEPVEVLVEAALELVSGSHVGRIAISRPLLYELGRAVRSLDGLRVVGDAQMPVDLARGVE